MGGGESIAHLSISPKQDLHRYCDPATRHQVSAALYGSLNLASFMPSKRVPCGQCSYTAKMQPGLGSFCVLTLKKHVSIVPVRHGWFHLSGAELGQSAISPAPGTQILSKNIHK